MGGSGKTLHNGKRVMRNILCKVYAGLSSADEPLRAAVENAARSAVGRDEDWLFLDGDNLLRISFEGIYFPLEEVLEALDGNLTPEAEGKLDYLDLEAWTLERHIFQAAPGTPRRTSATRSLNHVLAYSGH